jgi:membrane dipeptidase
MVNLTPEQETRAKSLHQRAFVVEGHSDYLAEATRLRNQGETRVLETYHLPSLLEGGVNMEVLTVGCDEPVMDITNTPMKVIKVLDDVHQELRESDKFHLITRYEDIDTAKNAGKIGLLLALEGARPIREDLFLLRTYYRLGLRQVGLTWNQRNLVADGCGEEKGGGGLSNFGQRLLEEMNRLHIILDLSHVHEKSFLDAIEIIKSPPVASHSNAKTICNFPRNLSDTQIRALADRGGTVGMCFFGSFVTNGTPTLDALIDQVDYIVNLVGVDHIALGPDYIDYIMDLMKAEEERMKDRGVDYGPLEYVQGLETVSTLGNITRALVARDYSDEDIEKILGGNLLRVYKEGLK